MNRAFAQLLWNRDFDNFYVHIPIKALSVLIARLASRTHPRSTKKANAKVSHGLPHHRTRSRASDCSSATINFPPSQRIQSNNDRQAPVVATGPGPAARSGKWSAIILPWLFPHGSCDLTVDDDCGVNGLPINHTIRFYLRESARLTFKSLQKAVREFLRKRTSYDVLPLSFRLIILNTDLLVKKSLNILLQNGMQLTFPPPASQTDGASQH